MEKIDGIINEQNSVASVNYVNTMSLQAVSTEIIKNQMNALLVQYIKAEIDSSTLINTLKSMSEFIYQNMDLFIVVAINLAKDYSEETQTEISSLITILCDAKLITKRQLSRAFEKLISLGQDARIIFNFIVSAIDDKQLSPNFIIRLPEHFIKNLDLHFISKYEPNLIYNYNELIKFKKACKEVVDEYMTEGIEQRLIDFHNNYKLSPYEHYKRNKISVVPLAKESYFIHEFVKYLLSAAFTGNTIQKEKICKFISDYYTIIFTITDIEIGVVRTLCIIDELILDIPNITDTFAKFICRFYIDELISPSFIYDFLRLQVGNDKTIEILRISCRWLSNGTQALVAKFEKVWFAADFNTIESTQFRANLQKIINYYTETNDLNNTIERYKELNASPDEDIYAIRKIVMAAMDQQKSQWMNYIKLIEKLLNSNLIIVDSIVAAFNIIKDLIPDIILDIPHVTQILNDYFVPQIRSMISTFQLKNNNI